MTAKVTQTVRNEKTGEVSDIVWAMHTDGLGVVANVADIIRDAQLRNDIHDHVLGHLKTVAIHIDFE